MAVIAMGVTCPIIVLNAKDIMVASETPLARVRVSKISAGIIHERGPQVAEKEKLYTHVTMMNPQEAPVFVVSPGGKFAAWVSVGLNIQFDELTKKSSGDNERHHVRQVTPNQRPATSETVNE